MAKDAVTRTFSIGTICGGNEASEDFPTARRVRALQWATSSARSLGCSLGSDFQTSRESIYPNILTPESIPQFTIPTLSVQSSLRSLDKEPEEEEEEEADSEEGLGSSGAEPESSLSPSSTSSSGFGGVASDRKAERSVSDPFARRGSRLQRKMSYAEAQHCLDPASKAALSLPHLTKVTTPYGFVTLSQSPQMASEEALLHQAGLRRSNKDEEAACGLQDKRRAARDLTDWRGEDAAVRGGIKATPSSRVSVTVSSPPPVATKPDGKQRNRFYQVIRKHFTSFHKD
ncbi:C2 calcium-dependent domain-containing protein 4C [Liparis tanakae]|uniref:C2 calcium-dependent domain-containing protein 4C n=1 Tax=Liparis tanakae TaxID=230148 RepID=A0A4Z2IAJ1_9TELE|nr:C2 calcium-dependent domain-containing protein 4C [Liparis tanakae]